MDELNSLIDIFINDFGTYEDKLLQQLTRETAITQVHPRMLSGKYQGHLLSFLIKITNSIKLLEIGTYTGYSAICMARALPPNGKIITIEKNDEIEWLSQKYFKLANLENKIEAITGNALDIIPNLDNDFDIIFIDGDKREYLSYYKTSLPKLKKNGLIIADNVLWNNKIFSKPASNDNMTKGVIEFNDFVNIDNSVEKIILPIRDGLMLLRKL
jgi:predicted O-methyltransferase YrrM